MLLLKNHNFYPIFTKLCENEVLMRHEYIHLTKFRNDWVKIVDFLIKAYFLCVLFLQHTLICLAKTVHLATVCMPSIICQNIVQGLASTNKKNRCFSITGLWIQIWTA